MNIDDNTSNSFSINPLLKIDHVHLSFKLKRIYQFYQSILGFKVLKDTSMPNTTAFLASSSSSSSSYVAVNYTNANTISEDKRKNSPLLILTQIDNNDTILNHKNIRKESGLIILQYCCQKEKI